MPHNLNVHPTNPYEDPEPGKTGASEAILRGGATILGLVQQASKLSSLPYLSNAAGLALNLVQIAQTVQENKEGFKELADDSAQLVAVFYRSYQGARNQAEWLNSDGIRTAAKDLERCLFSIKKLGEKMKARGLLRRVLCYVIDANTIKKYRQQLSSATTQFQVAAQLDMRDVLVQIEKNQDELLDEVRHLVTPSGAETSISRAIENENRARQRIQIEDVEFSVVPRTGKNFNNPWLSERFNVIFKDDQTGSANANDAGESSLLAQVVCVEVQRHEAARRFAVIEPPSDDDIKNVEDIHLQLAAYLETPRPPDPFIAADELPALADSLKKWIKQSRQTFIVIAHENVGPKRSQAERNDNRHTMDALRIEFLKLFAVLGRCPSARVIQGPNEDGDPDNQDKYSVSYIDGPRDVGIHMERSTDAIAAPTSNAQNTEQRRIDSVLATLKSLVSVQQINQGLLQEITTKMAMLDEADATHPPDEPVWQPVHMSEWYHQMVHTLTIEIFDEKRSRLFKVLQEDRANMMMDVHVRSGYPWRQIDLWKRKQRLTTELLAEYLRSLPGSGSNSFPLNYT
ncbi:hypothetical protein D9619_010512 [Psilocybe cf. subviscida]|uniref:Uncharacterized protein n=1 Tax=Psilocybe cf. subviscida TaxID=2480587 RepID=A0A8H5ASJ9_9AGAR|nr:hypothetical protein D9619_010512 [Psilocybe cf. subviscida]